MNTLVEWMGKTEDINITYDIGLPKGHTILAVGGEFWQNLPAVVFKEEENYRDVSDVIWEETVKKADQFDYLAAVGCGTISGLIDVFFVGEVSLDRANKWGDKEVNKFVKKVANLNGFKGDDLNKAVKYLEQKFQFVGDKVTPIMGGGKQHHLRDFSHHFSLGGLACSLFTQFSGKVIGTDTSGKLLIVDVPDTTLVGKNFEEKLFFGAINWFFHIVSDMAGSSITAGKGIGVPGPIVSLIKEMSVLPCFKDKVINDIEFHTWISKLFNGTLLAKRDKDGNMLEAVKFDLRTEIGLLHEASRQFIPVLINECLVRGIYFIRRLYNAIKDTDIHSIKDLTKIDATEIIPYNNRTVKRMMTVASGVFVVIDAADAAIRAVIKNKSLNNPKFYIDFAVRINIVGIGRFIVACKQDSKFITEDIREAREKRFKVEEEYERTIADLQCLALNYEQLRALYSLEHLIIQDDIKNTKKVVEKLLKEKWQSIWQKKLLESLPLVNDDNLSFFMDLDSLAQYFTDSEDGPWKYLIVMETGRFAPYYPFGEDEDEDKEYKKLNCKDDYLSKTFAKVQNSVIEGDIERIEREYKHSIGTITGSRKNMAIGAVGTTAVVLATGGFAFAFAPVIATALVGEASLSGAALVSYSLATIGGGSLAAGGLGMAGGTAIITGGGAMLGMLGGGGVSAATTINMFAQDGYVLSECCKLLTFSKAVLVEKYSAYKSIGEIKSKVDEKIILLNSHIEEFSDEDDSLNKEELKERKLKTKVAKKSLKYLRRCSDALDKILSVGE